MVRYLGSYDWDISPIREEIQRRHVFQLALDDAPPEVWTSQELHDGTRPSTNLYFEWLPLGHPMLSELVVGQGTLLDQVRPVAPRDGSTTKR